jgi:hypothetical protein
MTRRTTMTRTIMLFALGMLALGCGANNGGGGGGTSSSSSSSSYSCCRNESFYSCKSEDGARACFNKGDVSDCTRDSSKDNTCKSSGSSYTTDTIHEERGAGE